MTPEVLVSDISLAQALDAEIIELTKQLFQGLRLWARIGQIVVTIDRERLYESLGYKSHGAWLKSVEARTGYCRASLYHFKEKYLEIESHPHVTDLVDR